MKNKYNIIKIIGICIVVIGIMSVAISLIRFDVFKYNLMAGITVGLMVPAVGIFIIVLSTILGARTLGVNDKEIMSNIAKQAKETINEENLNNSENATVICKYCGAKVDKNEKKCTSCGASLGNKK